MAQIFEVENRKIVISEKALMVPQFKAILDHYEFEDDAITTLTYLYGMNDISRKNPWVDVAYWEKDAVIKKSLYGKSDYKFSREEQKLLNDAVEVYTAINKESPWRLLQTINQKIDEVDNYLRTNKVNTSNLANQISVMDKINNLLKTRAYTEKIINEELENTKAKGDMTRSPLETGQIGYVPATKND